VSADRLMTHLGLMPGSVSPFALIHRIGNWKLGAYAESPSRAGDRGDEWPSTLLGTFRSSCDNPAARIGVRCVILFRSPSPRLPFGRCWPSPVGAEHRSPCPEIKMRPLCHCLGSNPPRRRRQAPPGRIPSAVGGYTFNGVTPQRNGCKETWCFLLERGPP
jgi:hypothetical protein